ncbi:MAG: valine--tRNA ligase [Candidatus Omnitrophica bacterium]|nr:valine--tRNA ligase [Candidatus Omnitrophota bacterium]
MTELESRFNFKEIDEKWGKYWESDGVFRAKVNPDKKSFTIVIPPPNVTGILHMGHALNNTLQDILIRYKRMTGFETLWMPGTDHAGIATQNVVEKQLAKEGKTRQDIGREQFTELLWSWKNKYGDTIIHQLKKLGSSCDWDRTRFTMDDEYSLAVKEVFIRLYHKGLIYRGEYIINWCPRCHTALSDEEAEHKDTAGKLYHIKYPIKGETGFVVVATTRPETMLGDTAVAVNPEDQRYASLRGKILMLPLVNREIPIIEDAFVDPAFGTGAVKVTPAHDPNDFHMGRRHNLRFINILYPDGKINRNGGQFHNMDRFVARKAVVEELDKLGLLVKIDEHSHAVGHCYRCNTVVEPYLSKQWFVKMAPLAQPAVKAVEEGRIKFYPDRWTKVYMNWMENIRDWCISRQIWWGHRIPVWYCQNCPEDKNMIVTSDAPAVCPHCGSKDLKQDEDVLDTWFSSWLWPFATLNWPKASKDLKYFYPGSALFTASEIIFFWVARMIMAGIEFMGDIPFSEVYIHGTVRDALGRKMSKSLGNAIDPLEIINEYGADALRFSLIINSGQDLYISKEKFEIGRNFANKIWNASRLILMNAKTIDPQFDLSKADLDLASQWIVSRMFTTVKRVGDCIDNYRYSEAESLINEFFWSQFCDWYLEIIKDQWDNPVIQNTALKILENSLKIIHPFMPFVTQELWAHIHPEQKDLGLQNWPKVQERLIQTEIENKMALIIELVTSIRNTRAEWNVKPAQKLDCVFVSDKPTIKSSLKETENAVVKRLAGLKSIEIRDDFPAQKNMASGVIADIKFYLSLEGAIDMEAEKRRILSQIEEQTRLMDGLNKRLSNEAFISKAKPEVVANDRQRLVELGEKIKKLKQIIADLE